MLIMTVIDDVTFMMIVMRGNQMLIIVFISDMRDKEPVGWSKKS